MIVALWIIGVFVTVFLVACQKEPINQTELSSKKKKSEVSSDPKKNEDIVAEQDLEKYTSAISQKKIKKGVNQVNSYVLEKKAE